MKTENKVDGGYTEYLENYKNFACSLVKKIDDGLMPESNGGLLGVMRAVSEYDNLASIKSLYDAAYEADACYSSECREW